MSDEYPDKAYDDHLSQIDHHFRVILVLEYSVDSQKGSRWCRKIVVVDLSQLWLTINHLLFSG